MNLGRADARVYRGHGRVRESFERWLDQWDEYGTEAERFVDCGDDALVVAREHGRGARSGATVSARIFVVVTFRDGKVLRYREFYDKAAALEAVGGCVSPFAQRGARRAKRPIERVFPSRAVLVQAQRW